MKIMPIINNGSYNVSRYNPSCKGAQSPFDTKMAELKKKGYSLVNDGTITTEDGKYLYNEKGEIISGYFLARNGKNGYELLVADESLNTIDSIRVGSSFGDKYWCISKEPTSKLDIKLPNSKILSLNPDEIPGIIEQATSKEDKAALENAIKQATSKKNDIWKIMKEGYKIFLQEIKYQSGIRFLSVHADSQQVVEFFRELGFVGGNYNPKSLTNALSKQIGKMRVL